MPKLNDLSRLARFIARHRVKNIQIVGSKSANGTKFQELFFGLLNDSFESENDAAKTLYGTSAVDPNYKQLKNRLHHRLLDTIFFIDIDQPGQTEIQKAYYTCYKNLAAVKILMGKYARKDGEQLAEKTLRLAIKYDFVHIVLELSRDLRMHYAYTQRSESNYKRISKVFEKYNEVYNAESLVEKFYSHLISKVNSSKGSRRELFEVADKYSKALKKKMKEHSSLRFDFHAYLVLSMRNEIKNDYKENLKVCEAALEHFKAKDYIGSNAIIVTFMIRILSCTIHLRDFERAKSVANKLLSLPPKGTNNWYHALDYIMILHFHTQNYQAAYQVYRKAVNHRNFSDQYENILEHWRIHEAYIHLLISLGKIAPEQPLKKFRLNKFLNDVPTYAKDKRGANINILILQVLFLLQQKRYGAIVDRMEALRAYIHRHLRRDETYRSNCFLKMLLTLPKASFHRKAVIRKAEKYYERLNAIPLGEAKQGVELELIPYDHLWAFTLELLDDDWHGAGGKENGNPEK